MLQRSPHSRWPRDYLGRGLGKAGRRIEHPFNPAFPCGVKINAWKVGENIEASRITAKTKEAAPVCELLWANAFERRAKLGKRSISRSRVSEVRFYEEVYVRCKARLRVKDHGISTPGLCRSPASAQLQAEMAADGLGRPLQCVQGNTGIFRIEQAVECAAAGLHARGHGSLGEAILFHGSFDLIGEDLFDGLFLAFPKNALFGEKAIEGRPDSSFTVGLFLESHR
ncbi:MAG: hypothetical protein ACLQVN_19335 [Bryobacteraceae bacterium]